MYTVYSFTDVSVIISHPSVGQYVTSATGLGSITVNMANEVTNHDVAADGAVMISKIKARNGSAAIAIQQTSDMHAWLQKWYNYLEAAPASEWAKTVITVRAPNMQQLKTLTGVSPQKQPDSPYQAQGQHVTWTLMAADIQQDAV